LYFIFWKFLLPFSDTLARYCGVGLNCKSTSNTCVPGGLCLNPSGYCVHINTAEKTIGLPGRKDEDSLCIAAYTSPAIICSQNYCLLGNICVILSEQVYVAQEKKTSLCLKAGETKLYGASSCIKGYSLL